MDKARRDIRALSLEELRRFFTSNAVPAFKGNQVYEWLWSKGSHDFEGMTNLSKSHRSLLEEHFVINHIEVDHLQRSADGTVKILDLGLARINSASLLNEATVVGANADPKKKSKGRLVGTLPFNG